MSTTVRSNSTQAHEVLEAARAMVPAISARAAEIETARRLPADLLGQLVAAGCFRILLPASHGGIGADLPTALRVFESLSRADASVGWTVMLGAASWIDPVYLPRATFDAIYADGPDVILAGTFAPSGSAEPVAGGYRVNGRWAFASGCEHAAWLWANCMEGDQGPRIVLFSPDEVTIEDTWHVSGLRGTGSHHFRADNVLVPTERTARSEDVPCLDAPIVRIPPPALFALITTSIALGAAQGAWDEMLALATHKVPLLGVGPLVGNPMFQVQLAHTDTELRAARALLYETATGAWEAAVAGTEFSLEQRARIRAAGVWVTERAAAVVTTAYRAGGGSSLYADNPLQRRLRDINAVTQHFLVKPDTLTTAGALLAGQNADVTVF